MSTLVLVDPESSTQADGAQSSRVPVPLLEDPYEAIRHAYLDGTDTESEPFEDPIDTETPESPLTIAPPTSLSKSTPFVLVPILYKTARMALRIPPAMSSGLSASMAEVAAMSESAFRKRFRSSYESSPSCHRQTFLRGSVIEAHEGYHGNDDEVRGLDDEGHSVESDGLSMEKEDEAVPGGQPQATPVVGTTVGASLGFGYGALRRRELVLEEDHVYSMFKVGQGSGSAPESERPERVSASRQPTLTTWTDPEDGMVYIDVPAYTPPSPPIQTPPSPEWTSAIPATAETEGFLTELGAQVEMHGGLIRDHVVRLEELSRALFERYDRDIGELFTRSGVVRDEIISLEGENWDFAVTACLGERRARLELAENVDGMRRGQEPRGGA
ncbi:hypothetical protein Tco_0780622 [Tanacetum coccineum]